MCVWFTGLSGAGKTSTAEALTALLRDRGRPVTVLDGDVVRSHLSKGLGFGKEDRDTNVRRIGFVAAEIVKHGGRSCAAISPYRATREECRALTGCDAPYEPPTNAELTLETVAQSAEDNAQRVLAYLRRAGFVVDEEPPGHSLDDRPG